MLKESWIFKNEFSVVFEAVDVFKVGLLPLLSFGMWGRWIMLLVREAEKSRLSFRRFGTFEYVFCIYEGNFHD